MATYSFLIGWLLICCVTLSLLMDYTLFRMATLRYYVILLQQPLVSRAPESHHMGYFCKG